MVDLQHASFYSRVCTWPQFHILLRDFDFCKGLWLCLFVILYCITQHVLLWILFNGDW